MAHYLLTAFVVVSSLTTVHSRPSTESLRRRQVDNGPIEGWTFVGCFSDSAPASRTLRSSNTFDASMTPAVCTAFCQGDELNPTGFNFAGVEFTEAICDFNIQGTATQVADEDCDFPCGGDDTLVCGGAGLISVYTNGGAPPDNKATVGDWTFDACHTDAVGENGRTLTERFDIPGGVTIESCTATCEGLSFTIAGLEFGQECWCGNSFLFPDTEADLGDCSFACAADPTELCGAASRMSVYTFTPPV